MAVFDKYIMETARYVEKMCDSGRQVREFSCADLSRPLPLRVGPGAGDGIIVKSDTHLELGSPAAGSCAFVLYSNRISLVHDGRVRLVGLDIPEAPPGTLSFGQVIIVAGNTLTDKDYQSLVQSQYIGDKIEGYMVKSMPGRIWSRISNQGVQKGFNFGFLGRGLVKLVKAEVPKVTAAEVLFVTSDRADVELLSDIEAAVNKLATKIKSRIWKERGIDISDCAFGGHCGLCKDRTVCDKVNKAKVQKQKVKGDKAGRAKSRISCQ
ncbi:MAG: carbon monoxide dehydrogenase [Syntrophorhabdaceae bacterium]